MKKLASSYIGSGSFKQNFIKRIHNNFKFINNKFQNTFYFQISEFSRERIMEKRLNKEKFNVKSTYCESKYTTQINYDYIPDHVKIKAQKIESELLNSNQGVNSNRHIQEERGLIKAKDFQDENEDEEFRYSSVYRENIKLDK